MKGADVTNLTASRGVWLYEGLSRFYQSKPTSHGRSVQKPPNNNFLAWPVSGLWRASPASA